MTIIVQQRFLPREPWIMGWKKEFFLQLLSHRKWPELEAPNLTKVDWFGQSRVIIGWYCECGRGRASTSARPHVPSWPIHLVWENSKAATPYARVQLLKWCLCWVLYKHHLITITRPSILASLSFSGAYKVFCTTYIHFLIRLLSFLREGQRSSRSGWPI